VPTSASERFAANLKRLREERDWSQEELSRRSGLHTTAISKLERGRRSPRFPTVIRLAETFEIPAGELFEGIDFSRER
jgi:transcriptional regulator with XRE-family HTH domain